MKLPGLDRAFVPPAKITEYFLSSTHPIGRSEAAFFARFGYHRNNWGDLAKSLLAHAAEHEVSEDESSSFGTKYVIEGRMLAPDGRHPSIRAVWFIDDRGSAPRLITAYPARWSGADEGT